MQINSFKGEFDFLSNFYWFNNTTIEHQYQASKTTDPLWQTRILQINSPGGAKKLGRRAPLRADWESIKVNTMFNLVWKKFQDPILANKLLITKPKELIEGNYWHDNFWGVCYCQKCISKIKSNMLGRILMNVRDII